MGTGVVTRFLALESSCGMQDGRGGEAYPLLSWPWLLETSFVLFSLSFFFFIWKMRTPVAAMRTG
jgi:hypothetical protein